LERGLRLHKGVVEENADSGRKGTSRGESKDREDGELEKQPIYIYDQAGERIARPSGGERLQKRRSPHLKQVTKGKDEKAL